MSPGGSQASAREGFSPCNIGIGNGNDEEDDAADTQAPKFQNAPEFTLSQGLVLLIHGLFVLDLLGQDTAQILGRYNTGTIDGKRSHSI